MTKEYTAKKILLTNADGDYLIPYTETSEWGDITGSLENQTDLKNALDAKQDALSIAQKAVLNSGITSAKVSKYDGYESTIAGKLDKGELAKVATSGSYTDLTNTPTIPSEVTETTVSGWGFTKNEGTITEVKMNGATIGTSGSIDLGTVITSHQDISGKQDKLTAGANISITDNTIAVTGDLGSKVTFRDWSVA